MTGPSSRKQRASARLPASPAMGCPEAAGLQAHGLEFRTTYFETRAVLHKANMERVSRTHDIATTINFLREKSIRCLGLGLSEQQTYSEPPSVLPSTNQSHLSDSHNHYWKYHRNM